MRYLLVFLVLQTAVAELSGQHSTSQFPNPVTEDWIRSHLQTTSPRLILTSETEQLLRQELEQDSTIREAWDLLLKQADKILKTEPLVYKKTGKRLLSVSREALRRLSTLALAYRIEKAPAYLAKIEEDLEAICGFDDWNPSHFLDVAEMAFAVALTIDWCGEWMHDEVRDQAHDALIEKALKPGLDTIGTWWVDAHHNWNLVCHGGLAVAALVTFEKAPELATRTLHRSVEKIPLGLGPYAPDGVYPEGPSYWFYATDYLTATLSAFQTALGTRFGFAKAPGLQESALYSQITAGATGDYYNFFDAGTNGFHSLGHFGLLAWFGQQGTVLFDWDAYREALAQSKKEVAKESRFHPLHLLSIVRFVEQAQAPKQLPEAWVGRGDSPIGVLRDNNSGFYLAAKGGRAADNHGNMDAGSFIFELNGVRWSVDPGNQSYHPLEVIMGDQLWNRDQNSPRWQLLTKNNYGHSTLTVNGNMHLADARATLKDSKLKTKKPRITFDLTPVFDQELELAERTFRKKNGRTLQICDRFVCAPHTQTLTWQFITQAEVIKQEKGVLLKQKRQSLNLRVKSPKQYEIKVVPLSPPPLDFDKDIPNLKRVEIQFDRSVFGSGKGKIVVLLSGN